MAEKLYRGKFFNKFMIIYDRRQVGKVRHKLIDIVFIAVAASICGCNDWLDMEAWAIERKDWLKKYLELPNGIPSCYTIERVFDTIDTKQFEKCFVEWMKEATQIQSGEIVAIDGKTVCGSAQNNIGQKPIHIVNAWCSNNGLILGQVKTDEKSNEITAIPELLDLLFIKGTIVTIDAMGCQKDIARKIVTENKADYVLSLKGNHPLLNEEIERYFSSVEQDGFKDEKVSETRTIEKGHGRIEERLYYYSTDTNWLESKKDWLKLNGIGMTIRKCTVSGKQTEERVYHLTSVKTVKDYSKAVRLHWGVESTHWSLDVTFGEDANRTRKGKAPQNLALLKRLALNMVKKDKERKPKRSLKSKRFIALLNLEYLEYIFKINFS